PRVVVQHVRLGVVLGRHHPHRVAVCNLLQLDLLRHLLLDRRTQLGRQPRRLLLHHVRPARRLLRHPRPGHRRLLAQRRHCLGPQPHLHHHDEPVQRRDHPLPADAALLAPVDVLPVPVHILHRGPRHQQPPQQADPMQADRHAYFLAAQRPDLRRLCRQLGRRRQGLPGQLPEHRVVPLLPVQDRQRVLREHELVARPPLAQLLYHHRVHGLQHLLYDLHDPVLQGEQAL
ncbi:hypothetical protein IWQ56_002999, partial [Coemansia nantahalensis]